MFKELVIEWLQKRKQAAKGSNLEFTFGKALRSLKECNSPLNSANDLLRVKHFGPKLCEMIAKEVRVDSSAQTSSESQSAVEPISQNDRPFAKNKRNAKSLKSANKEQELSESPVKKKRAYCPKPRSGGYAILIALYKADKEGQPCLPKNELIQNAQPYCSESLSVAKFGSHYSAWNSVKTLVKNKLVEMEKHRYATYSLTDAGRSMAKKILDYETENGNYSGFDWFKDISSSSDCDESDGTAPSQEPKSQASESNRICMPPYSFDIILIVDSREQYSGAPQEMKKTGLLSELHKKGIKCEMKVLPVGDFTWIARKKINESSHKTVSKDLILDLVIERKRIDDLASSMIDNRWGEQKYRLKNSGVRMPTYLIEEFSPASRKLCLIPFQKMNQAVINAQVIDGLKIKFTKNLSDTISYLVTMTRYLESFYGSKTLFSCSKDELVNNKVPRNYFMTFAEFERNSTKISNFTTEEMFIKHLLQFKGVSVTKAKCITKYYKTVACLLDAYEICETEKEKKELLSSVESGIRTIGPLVSARIYKFYNSNLKNERMS
ncbi:ERCC4-like protein [Dinothrombium tinctorium]|uniref:Crossover junction endonuclease MUS81 n=1 Tax=Dinothrombium tinctorium TaxID=1965070 RepID=A0A443R6M5_9ACAR|nr:ERCC4-like protein [Dinothrombium tinctorium]